MFIFAISIKLINTNSYTFCVHIANPYTYSVIFAKPNNRHYTYMEIRLKELCQLKGVTQKELSAQLGVSEMTLSRASKGNTSIQLLERIAEALMVEIWELFTESTEKSNFIAIVKDGKDYYNAVTLSELEKIVEQLKEKTDRASTL